ncbi:TPA: C47 family peptidase [Enterococcus faecium]|nr:C47 family peptidase [Enterococcus faecium]
MYTFSNPVRKYSSSPSIIPKAEGQKYLNLDFLETQGSNNWCAAYVTTSIIRYANKSNSPTARQMMQHYYPNSSNLESQAASREKCMDYGYLHNFFNMVNVNSPITVSGTQLEINEESPFYIAASSDSTTATHAFTVRGYANFDFYQTISVWNPWSDASYGYDLMDPSSHTISTHGMVWKNFGTIYGWHHP